MDSKVIAFYRGIFEDPGVDRQEAAELTDFLSNLNPPPDKLIWMRANAFKIGCEYLSDDADTNVNLLRTINYLVHSIETICMEPKELVNTVDYDGDVVEEFYKSLYDGLSVDSEESEELAAFFKESQPPNQEGMVSTRAAAFKVGCDFLTEDKEHNISLLRCINVVVHNFEIACLKPKPFHLHLAEPVDVDMNISDAVQHIWNLDVNRLSPATDYTLNVQRGKKPYWKEDSAADPLFTWVDHAAWKRPTYAAFLALLDNYQAETGVSEKVTDTERSEIWDFLNAIYETAPMQFCHEYCHAKDPDRVPPVSDKRGFLKLMHSVWFDMYRRERGGRTDSSGFEHVFVGEEKNGAISGFHNWIQFYLEEKKGTLDYRGYIKPRSNSQARADGDDFLLTLQFSWNGIEKFVGTSFIGVSPEFEMALYTTCFLVGEQENEVELDTGDDVFGLTIKCYKMAGDKVGTSFPEVTSHYEE